VSLSLSHSFRKFLGLLVCCWRHTPVNGFLADHDRWRSLLVAHSIQGVQVHDSRLAASMYVHGVGQLLTINVRDFKRFEGLCILNPAEFFGAR